MGIWFASASLSLNSLTKEIDMGDKPISFRDADGNFVSAADVWNEKKLEELFNRLNPKRALRLARTKKEETQSKK